MDHSRCFASLSKRGRNIASFAMIQDDMFSGVVDSASLIASALMKFWPWRGGMF